MKSIPTHQPVIDVCALTVNDEHYLAALTDKSCSVTQMELATKQMTDFLAAF